MKKRYHAAKDRLVVFPRSTAVGPGRSILKLAPGDGAVELEVDRFVRMRVGAGDLVEEKSEKPGKGKVDLPGLPPPPVEVREPPVPSSGQADTKGS